ncbi:cytochrome b561 domain-containing protein 2 [Eurytemora carolleeae]|uniref:cytochrome b561 domain-containing protein 2 n=1 Tax=Eurytemora carolleeae TaxID=1294199 RepID=UPI000C763EDB|nr:cytochrome b561 domain-containing protein 2 [Eurytemora carolleeae]XP_023330252.1 cytochrome b561 domain-containing protein 2 [Eurytemora carolleeae]|eukprot:XP_023330251.1 cytochrome b561 domain-containing protein 2-like [Eurytemora affinis]
MVVHIISLGLTAFVLYLSAPGTDLFSWHPSLMTVAFALLLSQAIVLFSPESSLLLNSARSDKIQLHWILNLFAFFGTMGGFLAIYLNKEIAGKNHFTTWHGRFGLAAVIGTMITALWGLGAKYSSSLRSIMKPINIKLYHATFGLIVFCLGMSAISLACYSNWVRRRVEGYFWRIMFFTPIILAVCIARQVTQSYLPRVAKPEAPNSEIQERTKKK